MTDKKPIKKNMDGGKLRDGLEYVYAIEWPNGTVKMGHTSHFNSRLRQLQGAKGYPGYVEATRFFHSKPCEMGLKKERMLFKKFAKHRIGKTENFRIKFSSAVKAIRELEPLTYFDLTTEEERKVDAKYAEYIEHFPENIFEECRAAGVCDDWTSDWTKHLEEIATKQIEESVAKHLEERKAPHEIAEIQRERIETLKETIDILEETVKKHEEIEEKQYECIEFLREDYLALQDVNIELEDRIAVLEFENYCSAEELNRTAWHETGHVIGCFLEGYVPDSARIRPNGSGVVVCRVTPPPGKDDRMVLAGAYGIPRLFSEDGEEEIYRDFASGAERTVSGTDRPVEGDWVRLGKPSKEELDAMCDNFFHREDISDMANAVHDALVKKGLLHKKDLDELLHPRTIQTRLWNDDREVFSGEVR